jgi:hypothetical protein
MKTTVIIFLYFIWVLPLEAQQVGLKPAEIKALYKLSKTDAIVGKMLNGYISKAAEALTDTPNPRDTIVSEGHLKTHPDKIASVYAMEDYGKIYALALAYELDGDKACLDKASEFLTAWASVNHPQGNPINDTKLDYVFAAYDMLRPKVGAPQKKIIDSWMMTMADAEMATAKKGKSTSMNNWHSHRLKVVGQIGFILANKTYMDYAVNGLKEQIGKNLNADGTSWDFLERDALHYHAYDLEPMLALSVVIRRATGENLFTYVSAKGTSIQKSVDWFLPYLNGEKAHEEYVNSKVAFDRERAKNNEKGFEIGSPFDVKQGLYTLSLASYFDPSYLNDIKVVIKSKGDYSNWQSVINGVMR